MNSYIELLGGIVRRGICPIKNIKSIFSEYLLHNLWHEVLVSLDHEFPQNVSSFDVNLRFAILFGDELLYFIY